MQRCPLPYHADISLLFRAFAGLPHAVLLDSGKPRQAQGRYDIFSAFPQRQLSIGHNGIRYRDSDNSDHRLDNLPALIAILNAVKPQQSDLPFCGGWLGFCRYELGEFLEPCSRITAGEQQHDVFWAGYYNWAVVQDHQLQHCWLVWQDTTDAALLARIHALLNSATSPAPFTLTNSFTASDNYAAYQQAFNRIQHYIQCGDAYQVNYSQAFNANYSGDTFTAFQQLRHTVPSPYMAYINHGAQQLLSISPERFIAANGRSIHSKPIKGTAPRADNPAADLLQAQALQQSVKNRAENVMIVDLIRNDFGRHCTPGSIRVEALCELESFDNVHHLVSTISGTLDDHSSIWDVFFASFPGGSITGAPKIRACQIISELETGQRDIYCGCIFMASDNGQFDSNICIRTLLCEDGTISARAGGGIVADSTVDDEYQECFNKIQALLSAL